MSNQRPSSLSGSCSGRSSLGAIDPHSQSTEYPRSCNLVRRLSRRFCTLPRGRFGHCLCSRRARGRGPRRAPGESPFGRTAECPFSSPCLRLPPTNPEIDEGSWVSRALTTRRCRLLPFGLEVQAGSAAPPWPSESSRLVRQSSVPKGREVERPLSSQFKPAIFSFWISTRASRSVESR